jgi:MoxR-like ATPase
MQEKHATVLGKTYAIQEPFFVMATQNPLEMEGTFPLPEAQLDRFFFKLCVPYPSYQEFSEIVERTTQSALFFPSPIISKDCLLFWMKKAREIFLPTEVKNYAVRLVLATHPTSEFAINEVKECVQYGASPRGAQALVLAAKIQALLESRYNVSFDDIVMFVQPCLRHRVILNWESQTQKITVDKILEKILSTASR